MRFVPSGKRRAVNPEQVSQVGSTSRLPQYIWENADDDSQLFWNQLDEEQKLEHLRCAAAHKDIVSRIFSVFIDSGIFSYLRFNSYFLSCMPLLHTVKEGQEGNAMCKTLREHFRTLSKTGLPTMDEGSFLILRTIHLPARYNIYLLLFLH